MIKKIILLILGFVLVIAGLFLYYFLKIGTPTSEAPAASFGSGETTLEPARNIPDSNIFKETEVNPFDGAYTNPFE